MGEMITLRKQAVRRYLAGESKRGICRDLGKSPSWLDYWLERYDPDDPDCSLQDRSSAPHEPHRKWSQEVIQLALSSRRLRQEGKQPGYEYALIGAEAIHFELAALGIDRVPPVRTIHHWIQQAGLISRRVATPKLERESKPDSFAEA